MLLFFIVLYLVYWVYNSNWYNLKCIISDHNGQRYCIRDRKKLKEAVNLLAECVENMKKLVEHVKTKYPDDERVARLVNKFNPKKISETLPTSQYTAYSENKGERLAFCLNKGKDNNKKLIDLNTLTFVATHEMAHIMSVSIGHKKEFWDNMKFLIENASEINIYDPINYEKTPETYCGDEITNSPYFDE